MQGSICPRYTFPITDMASYNRQSGLHLPRQYKSMSKSSARKTNYKIICSIDKSNRTSVESDFFDRAAWVLRESLYKYWLPTFWYNCFTTDQGKRNDLSDLTKFPHLSFLILNHHTSSYIITPHPKSSYRPQSSILMRYNASWNDRVHNQKNLPHQERRSEPRRDHSK